MSEDRSSDVSGDASGEGQWLTYAELAAIRHIDRASAVRLAIRRHWRRQKGNTGREVRVLVPPEALTGDRSVDTSEVRSGHTSDDVAHVVSAFETALTTLREQLERSEARADRLDMLVQSEGRQLIAVEAKAAAAETRAQAAEKGREAVESEARDLRERLEQAEAAAEQARREAVHEAREAAQAFEALRAVEAARLAQGLLARLRAAWRGR
jgi:hypothetical protein